VSRAAAQSVTFDLELDDGIWADASVL
jgi:hypothetical protein